MKLAAPILALSSFVAACGGATPPPATGDAAKPGAANHASADDRKQWMNGCDQEPGLTDYCSCSFDVIVRSTTPEERNEAAHPNLKKALASLPEQCGAKLPVTKLKEGFMRGCAKDPNMSDYCSCSFDYLQKKDLVTKGAEAVKSVEPELKKACAAQLFDVTRRSFMKACEEKNPTKHCACTIDAMEKAQGREKLMAMFEHDAAEAKKSARAASIGCSAR